MKGATGLKKQFDKLKQEMVKAHEQAHKADELSHRLGAEMASVGGKDAKTEKNLASLVAELKKLEAWEATASAKHNDLLARVDSIQESQGM